MNRNRLAVLAAFALFAACAPSDGGTGTANSERDAGPVADAADATPDTGADTADAASAAIAFVEIDPTDPTLEQYSTLRLEARALTEGGDQVDVADMAWSSSDPDTVGVNRFGTIMANALGTATITASTSGVSGRILVTVVGKPVGSVDVTPAHRTLQIGEQVTLSVFLEDVDGAPIDEERPVAFSSTDDTVATVSSSGLVTGVGAGSATITATAEGKSASAAIDVEAPTTNVDRVEVTPTNHQLIRGDTVQLQAAVFDTGGAQVNNPTMTWTSSAPDVATVDGNGLVEAVGEGSATIIALSDGKSGTAHVDVIFSLEAIATGGEHACGLIAGAAFCWGKNDHGQLGRTTSSTSAALGRVQGGHQFSAITTGATHTCALTSSGDAYCWGNNADGQLGDASGSDQAAPVAVGGGHDFVKLSAGDAYTCGVDTQDHVWCWGDNADGQLGDGTTNASDTPVQVAGLSAAAVFAGVHHTCAIDASHQTYCWGKNDAGQLGSNDQSTHRTPVQVQGGFEFTAVAVGDSHSCGLATDTTVACWGKNDAGQLGEGTNQSRNTPILVSAPVPFSHLAAGATHTCALGSGDVYCWGNNDVGQLGLGASSGNTRPTVVPSSAQFSDLTAGGDGTCAIDANGAPFCWGIVTATATPAPVPGF